MSANTLRLSIPIPGASTKPAHAARSTRSSHALALTPRDIVAATSTDGRNARRRARSGSNSSTITSQYDSSSSSSMTTESMSCFHDGDMDGTSAPTSVATTVDDANDYISSKAAGTSQRQASYRKNRERVASAPDLHINTFLPLVLPPQETVKKASSASSSPMPSLWQEPHGSSRRAAPSAHSASTSRLSEVNLPSLSAANLGQVETSTGTATNVQALDLQRSDSLASFASSAIDGSWHGDEGDDDPDGQLERAVKSTRKGHKADDDLLTEKLHALNLVTRDYDASVDDWSFDYPENEMDLTADADEDSIRRHAGPLMHKVASFLFDGVSLDGIDSWKRQHRFTASTLDRHHDDCPRRQSLVSSMASPSDLTRESRGLRARTRPSSTTQATDPTLWDKLWGAVHSGANTTTAAGGAD